jgi:long-subunit fatty acid transport protein
MRKLLLILWLTIVLIITISIVALAGPGLGAKATAMGGAYSALADDSSGFYWNPAGMAQLQNHTPQFNLGISPRLFNAVFNGGINFIISVSL